MAGVVVCSLAIGLAGCGDDTPPEGDRAACADLVADLPERLGDLPRTREESYAVGWGAPAVELRCGVPEPDGLTQTSQCVDVDGIDWFAPEDEIDDQDRDATLTTVGRDPRVEVTVPSELRPPNDVLVELGDAVRAHTAETTPCR